MCGEVWPKDGMKMLKKKSMKKTWGQKKWIKCHSFTEMSSLLLLFNKRDKLLPPDEHNMSHTDTENKCNARKSGSPELKCQWKQKVARICILSRYAMSTVYSFTQKWCKWVTNISPESMLKKKKCAFGHPVR